MPYSPPEFLKTAFNCPYCGAYAQMEWAVARVTLGHVWTSTSIWMSLCSHCQRYACWEEAPHPGSTDPEDGRMVIPSGAAAPLPHPDMPAAVRSDYMVARDIASYSPRAATALLRPAIQKLCAELGESGVNINSDIKALVAKGLSIEIQQALDIIRVVGNNAVHPGELQPDDVADVALSLFDLTNQIVEERVAKPKKLKDIYDRLPKGALQAISKRDGIDPQPPERIK